MSLTPHIFQPAHPEGAPEAHVHVYPDREALAEAVAGFVVAQAQAAVDRHGRFVWALAGGSTPQPVYEALAQEPFRNALPWHATYVVPGDERLVPLDSPDSNLGTARSALLDHVPLPGEHILAADAALSPDEAAGNLDRRLTEVLHDGRLDLALLGLGEDGHTASIFPEDLAAERAADNPPLVRGLVGPARRPPRERVTLTLRGLAEARHVAFLVSGKAKRKVLRAILHGEAEAPNYPAAWVRPDPPVRWFVDEAAAGGDLLQKG